MNEFKITENKDKSPLPEWIGTYINVAEKFILANNCNPRDCFSSSKGEYVRYDIIFTDIGTDVFIAIMRLDDGIYYHVDCQIVSPEKMKTEDGNAILNWALWKLWMFKLSYRLAMNKHGGLSLSTTGLLQGISVEYFEILIKQLVPTSNYLLSISKDPWMP